MSDGNKIRLAHELLDEIDAREDLTPEQTEVLRSFLPERPKPVTLEQVFRRANAAWANARGNEWLREEEDLEAALLALRNDLRHLINEPKPAAAALPAGMRLADHVNFGRVVVSPGVGVDKCHEIFYLEPGMKFATGISEVEPDSLTFIDAEPEHPVFLETVEDYESAPVGTIAAEDERRPAWKQTEHWVVTNNPFDNYEMSSARRRVLRWGRGDA